MCRWHGMLMALVVMWATSGCGIIPIFPSVPEGCLEHESLEDIPPGNAVGSDLSGTYRIVSMSRVSCESCELNTLDDWDQLCTMSWEGSTVEDIVIFEQEDGILRLGVASAFYHAGGVVGRIDQNGRFEMGGTGGVCSGLSGVMSTSLMVGDFYGSMARMTLVLRGSIWTGDVEHVRDVQHVVHVILQRIE